jgi:hypothetical protein
MLVKERWIYDPARGLKRDIKNPQQSDDDLRSFLGGKNPVVVDIEEDVVVPPAKKQQRRAGIKHKRQAAAVPPDEIDFDDVLDPVPDKKKRKGKPSKDVVIADIFDDTNTESTKRAGKPKLAQPPIPPVPKGPPQVTADDINAMLDAKLERMFSVISKNQANLENSFVKALEEQKREFAVAQRAVSAPTRHAGLNISPSGGLNFSPSTALAGTGLFISNICIEFIVLL